ncbi:hypothetical protein ACFY19_16140 [Streptosporangium saharense]|uniref:hypothetical protein n=1 Tax=Streptosporangium saharense TaxID=1706840 RepID=UPI0036D1A1D1
MRSTVRNTGDVLASGGAVANSGVIYGDVHVGSAPMARSAYLKQVRRIAPPLLEGREAELAELAEFCVAVDGCPYVWWQAPAWAGKSALTSWFVLNPPPGVRVVSFFITARYAGQSDRSAFIDVVLEQLAELAGQPIPVSLGEATREAHLLDMLDEAARVCQEDGQRLVLVVDGLDEDRGVTVGPDAYSIAALLPVEPPPGVRVVVAGRPNPPVPSDVPHDHPLRSPRVVRQLGQSRRAQVIRADAERELKRLLHGTPVEQDLLGLIAAAGGGLSGRDLAELTGLTDWEVEEHLNAVPGRTFTARNGHWGPEAGPVVYVLAHEELQNTAVRYLGTTRLEGCRQRLHVWADRYRDNAWPVGTPEYLLRGYHRLLQQTDDQARMVALALDQDRHGRLLDVTGADAAAMTEITTIQRILRDHSEPDLLLLLRLSVVRGRLTDRSSSIPKEVVSALVRLGELDRAESLVHSMVDSHRQMAAVTTLIETMAECGHSAGIRRIAEDAERSARTVTPPDQQADALTDLAVALARHGDLEYAEEIVRTVPAPHHRVEALARLADALTRRGDLEQANRLVEEAESIAREVTDRSLREKAVVSVLGVAVRRWDPELAEGITDPYLRSQALACLADAAADRGDLDQTHRLIDRAKDVAHTIVDQHRQTWALSQIAEMLAGWGYPDRAERLARTIAHSEQQARTIRELVGTATGRGEVEKAESLAHTVTHPLWQAWAFAYVAEALGEHGDLERAETLAHTIRRTAQRERAFASLARTAASRGDRERAESLTRNITMPIYRAEVSAHMANAAAKRGDLTEARQLVDRAKSIASTDISYYNQAWNLVDLAEAVAESGDPARAVQIVDRVEGIAQSITPLSSQGYIVARLVTAAAQYGDLDRAETLAHTIEDEEHRARTMVELVETMVHRSDLARAEKLANTIATPYHRVNALICLAEATDLNHAHRLIAHAETIAHEVTDPNAQVRILNAIAGAVITCGDRSRARDLIGRAEQVARGLSDSRDGALASVAKVIDLNGERERAENLLAEISDPYEYARAMTEFVKALTWRGDVERAEELAKTIGEYDHRWQAIGDVARARIRLGDLSRAEALIRTIDDEYRLSETMASLPEAIAQKGDLDRAEKMARGITDPIWRTRSLVAVAVHADHDRARRIVVEILHEGEWPETLKVIAKIAPDVLTAITDEFLAS